MRKFLTRSCIVGAWICFIAFCLYAPKIIFSSSNTKSIRVFTWGDILEPSIVKAFEKETGIKVHLNYYSTNEEMITKLKGSRAKDYDLVVPSDYAVSVLTQNQLLKKIDKSRLPFWKEINPHLLGHFFDASNDYSIPFEWEICVFGIDTNYFKEQNLPSSWKLLFDKEILKYKISMTDDPVEATLFASFYLFGPNQTLNKHQIQEVKNLLIEQRPWVEAYVNFIGDYFLTTGSCRVAVSSSPYIWKTMNRFPFISFIIPEEGTFISIENLSIPAQSKKEDLTYQFINYLFQKDSVKTHFETFGFFPSTLHSIPDIQLDQKIHNLVFANEDQFKKFHFIQEVMPKQEIDTIWVDLKSGKY